MRPTKNGPLEAAIAELLRELARNRWFVQECWPDNAERLRCMVADAEARRAQPHPDLLDVGCFNGWMSFLFARLGYRVTATDALPSDERGPLLEKGGVRFVPSNLNEVDPLRALPDAAFDVAIMGEVIEHVLNDPLGLMKDVARVLRPRGLLILTTPNPSTVMGAARLLLNRHSLWGTRDFMAVRKIDGGKVISLPEIHYREYRDDEMRWLLEAAGFAVEEQRFMPMGAAAYQSPLKRLVKGLALGRALTSTRWFGSTQYLVARRA